jgi:hypothetical protein
MQLAHTIEIAVRFRGGLLGLTERGVDLRGVESREHLPFLYAGAFFDEDSAHDPAHLEREIGLALQAHRPRTADRSIDRTCGYGSELHGNGRLRSDALTVRTTCSRIAWCCRLDSSPRSALRRGSIRRRRTASQADHQPGSHAADSKT